MIVIISEGIFGSIVGFILRGIPKRRTCLEIKICNKAIIIIIIERINVESPGRNRG